MTHRTKHISSRAIQLRQSWLAAGVPGMVTAHEAYRLSTGAIGEPDDHSTPVSLAAAALALAKKEAGR